MLKRFWKKLKTGSEGFSLIEVLAAIVLLGILIVPVCDGIVTSVAVNRAAAETLQARLAVSSAVETMMAEGIQYETDADGNYKKELKPDLEGVTVAAVPQKQAEDTGIPAYFRVTVTEAGDTGTRLPVTVETFIRAVEKTP